MNFGKDIDLEEFKLRDYQELALAETKRLIEEGFKGCTWSFGTHFGKTSCVPYLLYYLNKDLLDESKKIEKIVYLSYKNESLKDVLSKIESKTYFFIDENDEKQVLTKRNVLNIYSQEDAIKSIYRKECDSIEFPDGSMNAFYLLDFNKDRIKEHYEEFLEYAFGENKDRINNELCNLISELDKEKMEMRNPKSSYKQHLEKEIGKLINKILYKFDELSKETNKEKETNNKELEKINKKKYDYLNENLGFETLSRYLIPAKNLNENNNKYKLVLCNIHKSLHSLIRGKEENLFFKKNLFNESLLFIDELEDFVKIVRDFEIDNKINSNIDINYKMNVFFRAVDSFIYNYYEHGDYIPELKDFNFNETACIKIEDSIKNLIGKKEVFLEKYFEPNNMRIEIEDKEDIDFTLYHNNNKENMHKTKKYTLYNNGSKLVIKKFKTEEDMFSFIKDNQGCSYVLDDFLNDCEEFLKKFYKMFEILLNTFSDIEADTKFNFNRVFNIMCFNENDIEIRKDIEINVDKYKKELTDEEEENINSDLILGVHKLYFSRNNVYDVDLNMLNINNSPEKYLINAFANFKYVILSSATANLKSFNTLDYPYFRELIRSYNEINNIDIHYKEFLDCQNEIKIKMREMNNAKVDSYLFRYNSLKSFLSNNKSDSFLIDCLREIDCFKESDIDGFIKYILSIVDDGNGLYLNVEDFFGNKIFSLENINKSRVKDKFDAFKSYYNFSENNNWDIKNKNYETILKISFFIASVNMFFSNKSRVSLIFYSGIPSMNDNDLFSEKNLELITEIIGIYYGIEKLYFSVLRTKKVKEQKEKLRSGITDSHYFIYLTTYNSAGAGVDLSYKLNNKEYNISGVALFKSSNMFIAKSETDSQENKIQENKIIEKINILFKAKQLYNSSKEFNLEFKSESKYNSFEDYNDFLNRQIKIIPQMNEELYPFKDFSSKGIVNMWDSTLYQLVLQAVNRADRGYCYENNPIVIISEYFWNSISKDGYDFLDSGFLLDSFLNYINDNVDEELPDESLKYKKANQINNKSLLAKIYNQRKDVRSKKEIENIKEVLSTCGYCSNEDLNKKYLKQLFYTEISMKDVSNVYIKNDFDFSNKNIVGFIVSKEDSYNNLNAPYKEFFGMTNFGKNFFKYLDWAIENDFLEGDWEKFFHSDFLNNKDKIIEESFKYPPYFQAFYTCYGIFYEALLKAFLLNSNKIKFIPNLKSNNPNDYFEEIEANIYETFDIKLKGYLTFIDVKDFKFERRYTNEEKFARKIKEIEGKYHSSCLFIYINMEPQDNLFNKVPEYRIQKYNSEYGSTLIEIDGLFTKNQVENGLDHDEMYSYLNKLSKDIQEHVKKTDENENKLFGERYEGETDNE